jgi:hypothetical protein
MAWRLSERIPPCVNACNLRQKSTEQAERKYRDVIVYAESNGDGFTLQRPLVIELEGLEGITGKVQLSIHCSYNAASDAIAYSARRGVAPSGKRTI